jgi:hypothetical protein
MTRAFVKFYIDSTRYNVAFSLLLLGVNPLAAIVSLPSFGLAVGLYCFKQFHGHQYNMYHNLGLSKRKLVIDSMLINLTIVAPFLLLFLINE